MRTSRRTVGFNCRDKVLRRTGVLIAGIRYCAVRGLLGGALCVAGGMCLSFSSVVKREIYAAAWERHCRVAMVSAIIAGAARVGDGICVKAENGVLPRIFAEICERDFRAAHTTRGNSVFLEDAADVKRLLGAAGLWSDGGYARRISALVVRSECCRRAYLAGSFLACGYMSDPERMYHAEFRVVEGRDSYAQELAALFGNFELIPHVMSRKGRHGKALYFKDGEQIAEILRIVGAHGALMSFEDERIRKSLGNRINRSVNFDAANVDKSILAAVKQIESINVIRQVKGLESLPPNLEELARTRLAYPEISLTELGKKLNPSLGKSGVNHRLRKLKEIARGLGST